MSTPSRIQLMPHLTWFEWIMLMVVLAMVGIYISLQWPAQDKQLRTFCSALAHDIRFTQHLAESTEQVHTVRFFKTQYDIVDANNQRVVHPVAGRSAIAIPEGIRVEFEARDPRAPLIAFDKTGTPVITQVDQHGQRTIHLDVLSQSAKHHLVITESDAEVVMT